MPTHKAFEIAGKEPGLQIWRVENMDLKLVPKNLHGNFYSGDAYILLYTTTAPLYSLHKWLGNKCSQDESGAAAIFAMQLDDYLGGKPRQYRETQGNESVMFQGYFKSGIKYKQGGVASGFQHVTTNDMTAKRLLHVKGRRMPRATEVDMNWSNFNKGDCFIIDLGSVIYLWAGSECNHYERIKTTELALDIRDNERGGRPTLEFIDEGDEPQAVIEVLGPVQEIAPAKNDDKASEKSSRTKASLYMISDAAGDMKSTLVAEANPFKQDSLSPSECYILDNGMDNKIFLWKGQDANKAERSAAMAAAEKFIKEKNYSSSTQIEVNAGGGESTLFKQFFFDWKDKYETTGPGQACTMGHIAYVVQIPFDASTLHSNKVMAAQHGMVDDGSGKTQVWRVEGGGKVEVKSATYGHFYGGDCYLILYSYKPENKEKHIIYTWQGLKCSRDELVAVRLDDSMGQTPVQVRVTQGQEPPHLMSLFKGKPMIVHMGGTSRTGGQSQAASKRLFHIRRSTTGATRAVEVEPSAEFLNTNDVFVLKTQNDLFIWKGVGSIKEEMEAAKHVASFLGGTVTNIDEGKEPVAFWAALGGKKVYQTSVALQNVVKPPRLFGCSNKTGRLIAEEVPGDFTQCDLATDDVMLLDTWDQIFIWVGKDANEVEKTGSGTIAKDYVESDPSGRRGLPITTIYQGSELPTFTGWFMAWNPKMWETDPLEQLQAR